MVQILLSSGIRFMLSALLVFLHELFLQVGGKLLIMGKPLLEATATPGQRTEL
jgi:hypothetical protein